MLTKTELPGHDLFALENRMMQLLLNSGNKVGTFYTEYKESGFLSNTSDLNVTLSVHPVSV